MTHHNFKSILAPNQFILSLKLASVSSYCYVLVNGVRISHGIQFKNLRFIFPPKTILKSSGDFVRDCIKPVNQFEEYYHLNKIKSSDPCTCSVSSFHQVFFKSFNNVLQFSVCIRLAFLLLNLFLYGTPTFVHTYIFNYVDAIINVFLNFILELLITIIQKYNDFYCHVIYIL